MAPFNFDQTDHIFLTFHNIFSNITGTKIFLFFSSIIFLEKQLPKKSFPPFFPSNFSLCTLQTSSKFEKGSFVKERARSQKTPKNWIMEMPLYTGSTHKKMCIFKWQERKFNEQRPHPAAIAIPRFQKCYTSICISVIKVYEKEIKVPQGSKTW